LPQLACGPGCGLCDERVEDLVVACDVGLRLLLRDRRFAKQVEGEREVAVPDLSQQLHRFGSGRASDELLGHARHLAFDEAGGLARDHPIGRDLAEAKLERGGEVLLGPAEVFLNMLGHLDWIL